MKKATFLAVICLFLAVTSKAELYTITFTDGGVNEAYGLIDIVSGFAVSGDLTITGGVAAGNWTLTPGGGNDGIFSWDNAVNPALTPFITGSGLLYRSSDYNINGYELNLWVGGGTSYNLWGNISGNQPQISGLVTTLEAVPEPSSAALGFLTVACLLGLRFHRQQRAAQASSVKG